MRNTIAAFAAAVASVLAVPAVTGTPLQSLNPCPVAPYSVYVSGNPGPSVAQQGFHCGVGPELGFFDFTFEGGVGQGGAPSVTAADITVQPKQAPGSWGLGFLMPENLVVGPGQSLSFVIGYTVDPHPIIIGSTLSMDTLTPVFPGSATVRSDLCIGGPFVLDLDLGWVCAVPGDADALQVQHNGITYVPRIDSTDFPPTNLVGVRSTVTLVVPPGNGGSSSFDGFGNGVVLLSDVPEPGGVALLLSGLAGLVLLRLRR